MGLKYYRSMVALLAVAVGGCSESRENAPNISGLYRCSVTSTKSVGEIPAGTKYYRYFNISINSESQQSVAYLYNLDNEIRTNIDWLPGTFRLEDRSNGMFSSKTRAWDGTNLCFLISPNNRPEMTEIDGRPDCALRFSPGSGAYKASVALLPEEGTCERVSD